MELRHLRYFVVLAEELHFGRAAERLHIAQPALSQQIMSLEQQLGVTLLDRNRRRVSLTSAGRLFLEEAQRTLRQAARTEQVAVQAHQGLVGQLTLGFTGATLYNVLPDFVRLYRERFPQIELILWEGCTESQRHALEQGSIDVGLLHPPIGDSHFRTEVVLRESLVLVLPENHPLAALPEVSIAQLAEEPFVLFARENGPYLHSQVMLLCEQAGFQPRIVHETSPQHTAVGLVAAGIGVSFVFESMQNLVRPGVVYRPIRETMPEVETVFAWRYDNDTPLLNTFRDFVDDFVSLLKHATVANATMHDHVVPTPWH